MNFLYYIWHRIDNARNLKHIHADVWCIYIYIYMIRDPKRLNTKITISNFVTTLIKHLSRREHWFNICIYKIPNRKRKLWNIYTYIYIWCINIYIYILLGTPKDGPKNFNSKFYFKLVWLKLKILCAKQKSRISTSIRPFPSETTLQVKIESIMRKEKITNSNEY